MALKDLFYVGSLDTENNVEPVAYTSVPTNALNVRKYAKKVAESNGARSYFETKFSEDGKGSTATGHYLISKVFEVPGPDGVLRPLRLNLAIHMPATAAVIDRELVLRNSLHQLIDFLRISPDTIGSAASVPDAGSILTSTRIYTILNGEI